jgi:hypothetical protein
MRSAPNMQPAIRAVPPDWRATTNDYAFNVPGTSLGAEAPSHRLPQTETALFDQRGQTQKHPAAELMTSSCQKRVNAD